MQFRFLESLVVLLHESECLVQGCARFGKSTRPRAAICQHAQVIGNGQLCARAPIGFQSLLQQPNSVLQSALQQQAASSVKRARCVPEKKPLFVAIRICSSPAAVAFDPQSAMLVEPTRVMQCVFEAEGVVDAACELDHLVIEFERLVRKTEVPQGQRQITAMSDAGILAHESGPKRRALAVVELGNRPRATLASPGKIAAIEPCQTLQEESLHQDAGIVESFAKRHGFVRQLACKYGSRRARYETRNFPTLS